MEKRTVRVHTHGVMVINMSDHIKIIKGMDTEFLPGLMEIFIKENG